MDDVLVHKRLERPQLDKLKAHPQQQHIFRAPKPEEIDRLAASLESEPSTSLVEILPDGTIVCGHSRVQAARQLGWTELDVWVRDDLAAQGEAAVLRRLINDNFNRRQLSPLDQARCLQQLFELEKENKQHTKGKGNLRDVIAAEHKMSGRNLERYLNVLKAPMEVQMAFDEKKLSLTEASRVAGMKAADQKLVAEAIARGEDPSDAVGRCLDEDKSWQIKPDNGTVSYLWPLETWKQKMKGRLAEIKTVSLDDAERIRKVMDMLKQLLQKAETQPVTAEDDEQKVAKQTGMCPSAGEATGECTGKSARRSVSPAAIPGAKKRTAGSTGPGKPQQRHGCRS